MKEMDILNPMHTQCQPAKWWFTHSCEAVQVGPYVTLLNDIDESLGGESCQFPKGGCVCVGGWGQDYENTSILYLEMI